jgi:hypothetical protein
MSANKIDALSDVSKKHILYAVKYEIFKSNNIFQKEFAITQARNNLLSAINQHKIPNIFMFSPINSRAYGNKTDLLDRSVIKKSVFINYLYNIYLYYDSIMEREAEDKSRIFYLERQLKWLGKEYNKNNWLEYINEKIELEQLFEELFEKNMNGKYLEKDIYQDFLKCITKKLLTLPSEWLPEKFYNNRSRYISNNSSPTHTTINSVLEKLALPYRIESKRVYKGTKRTVWCIKKKNDIVKSMIDDLLHIEV